MTEKRRREIRRSLVEQMKKRNALIPVFEDLIDDYMKYIALKERFAKDIETRGLVVVEEKPGGVIVEKENPSIASQRQTHKLMLAILKELGLSPDAIVDTEGSDDDL